MADDKGHSEIYGEMHWSKSSIVDLQTILSNICFDFDNIDSDNLNLKNIKKNFYLTNLPSDGIAV